MQVKFITSGANSAFGGFSAGDILRCSPEMAKHLVEEIKCARYMETPPPIMDEAKPAEAARPAGVEIENKAIVTSGRGRKNKAG